MKETVTFKGLMAHHSIDENPDSAYFSNHCHNVYEVIYIRRGKGVFCVEGTQYTIFPGAVFFFRPREYHFITVDRDSVYERYAVHFSPELLYESKELMLIPFLQRELGTYNRITDNRDSAILPLFSRLFDYAAFEGPYREIMVKLVLNELLITIHREFHLDGNFEPSRKTIIQITNYLDQNLQEKIRIDALADRFFISRHYLCHMFRKYMGISVMEYVIRKRVLLAQQLISEGKTATEAAYRSGFGDYSAFYRACMKYSGEKPSLHSAGKP